MVYIWFPEAPVTPAKRKADRKEDKETPPAKKEKSDEGETEVDSESVFAQNMNLSFSSKHNFWG